MCLQVGRFYQTGDKLFQVVQDGPYHNIDIVIVFDDLMPLRMTVDRRSLVGAIRMRPVSIENMILEDREHVQDIVKDMAQCQWDDFVGILLEMRLVKRALNRGLFPAYLTGQEDGSLKDELRRMVSEFKNHVERVAV